MRHCPSDLDVTLPEPAPTDLEPAIARAASAATRWSRMPWRERIARVLAVVPSLDLQTDPLARAIAWETGKPLKEACGELAAVKAKFALTAEDAERALAETVPDGTPHPSRIRRVPRGPAAVIAPFNFPLHLGNGAALAYLMAGNPVLFKPSPLAADVARQWGSIMEANLPEGVFQMVYGDAATGQALCEDPRVRAVCFTGSASVGRVLATRLAPDLGKELALELGGKNAAIVCEDADLESAARAVAEGACLTTGQRCNATSRVFVHRAVRDSFLDHLKAAWAPWTEPGDPLDPSTQLGPLISSEAADRFESIASRSDLDWIIRGQRHEVVGGRRGHWVTPGYFLCGRNQARDWTDPVHGAELFVPIVGLYEYDTMEEAATWHAAIPFGLTASVFTRSRETFERWVDHLEVGNVYANVATTFSPSTLPFGGLRQSGNGRPGGRGFIRFATAEQAIQMVGFKE